MYTVPYHIISHVNRIIREYEILYLKGHRIAIQLIRGNQIYSGKETTAYYLKTVTEFKDLLMHPQGDFFNGTEEEIRKRIFEKICEFYKPLSDDAVKRITHSVETQGQLDQALKRALKDPNMVFDARLVTKFVTKSYARSWCDADENLHRKVFKLIQSEDAFEKLFRDDTTMEITHKGPVPFTSFRMAVQIMDIPSIYRKQIRMREYNSFWEGLRSIDDFDTEYTIFNLWNNITETGIYYVYIPKN